MSTYRYMGHSMSDPGTSYRSREEVQEVRKTRDPITQFKQKILDATLVTEDQLKEIDNRIKKEVAEATNQSVSDPEVGLEELTADVYVNPIGGPIRNTVPDKPLVHTTVAQRR